MVITLNAGRKTGETEDRMALCSCGSDKERFAIHDARGIFVVYACEDCEEEKKSHYRPEIFEDGNYECDETIEPEDY
jgi:hypothetical protein